MSPDLVFSFITQYVKDTTSIVSALEPFTLFAILQRPGLLQRIGVATDVTNPHHIQLPVFIGRTIVDQDLLDESCREFWKDLQDSDRVEWERLSADIQELRTQINTGDIQRMLYGEEPNTVTVDGPGITFHDWWIGYCILIITNKCLLRSPSMNNASIVDNTASYPFHPSLSGPAEVDWAGLAELVAIPTSVPTENALHLPVVPHAPPALLPHSPPPAYSPF
jgi:hypothetical protein